MRSNAFPATRFDGRYMVAVPVLVRISGGELVVESLGHQMIEREALARADFGSAFMHAPRLITLPSGTTLELRDADGAFARGLSAAGFAASWPVRMQAHGLIAVCCVAAIVALATLAYLRWVPELARSAAFALSPSLEARMGNEVLAAVDAQFFAPSRLEPERVARIAARFAQAARIAAPGTKYRLEFRRMREGGAPNAFSLPGGVIILIDDAVEFADQLDADDTLLGILGHELGHVANKHPTRNILQSLALGTVGGMLWGDFSSTAANVVVVLGHLRNSRAFETEADSFAVNVLRAAQLTPDPLYRFFECIRRAYVGGAGGMPTFLSSHPSDEARLAHLRALGAGPFGKGACPATNTKL